MSRAKRVKRPNRIVYSLLEAYLGLYLFFRRGLRIRRHGLKGLKPPFVVLGNHASAYDFAIVALTMKRFHLHFVAASVFYFNPILRFILKRVAAIPRLQMVSDPVSVRRMLEVIRSGRSIGLFPHGQISYDGKEMPMPDGTGKLIKHMNVPVVMVKIQGAHLTRPKWEKRPRRGRIIADARILFTPQRIRDMSADQIDDAIRDALAFNDYDFSRKMHVPYASAARAERLEQLLYQCPRCHSLYRMHSQKDVIECTACHNKARMDAYGLLHPGGEGDVIFDDPVKWTAFERAMASRDLKQHGKLAQEVDLYVGHEKTRTFARCGKGMFTLTMAEMRYDGCKDGKPFTFALPNERVVALPFSFDKGYWELPGFGEYYRLFPKQRAALMRMALMLEAAHGLNGTACV